MASSKCPVCGTSVRADNLSKHLQSVHPREAKREMVLQAEREATKTARRAPARSLKSNLPRWVPVAVIILVLGLIGAWVVATTPASPYTPSTPVTQMCINLQHIGYARHDHVNLTIVILGVRQTIPANVGIIDQCMRPMHTHDSSGLIHVESPVAHEFTIGDFFTVWSESGGQPFSSTTIMGRTTGGGHTIDMTVDGVTNTLFEAWPIPHNTNINNPPRITITYR